MTDTNTTEHKCRWKYLETKRQECYTQRNCNGNYTQETRRVDDKLFAIMKCIDCGRIKKELL